VNPPTLVSIAITPAAPIVINGSTTQLVLTGTYSDTSSQAITAGVTWASATPANATIGTSTGIAAGLVTGGTTVITATLAGSTLVAAPATLTVRPAEYAFVTNFGDNTVSSFSVGAGGMLVANGAAVTTGIQPYALAADPTGNYLYVLAYNSGTASSVYEYTISASGTLTPLATIATGAGPNGIAVSGSSLYVANYGGGGTVSQYTIGAGGQLTAGAVVASQGGAAAVTINPAGTFAYVPNYTANTVSIFPIGTGGALGTPTILTLAANSAPVDVLVDPTGAYAYIANLGSASVAGYIAQYGINPSTGALTPLGTPTVTTGGNPRWLALNPAANGVYVPNAGLNTVQSFTFGSGGALSASGTPPATGTNPDFVVVDPTGQFVYVANRGAGVLGTTPPYASTVSQFAVGTGGALSPLSTPTVTTGLGPACILVTTAH
jgi:6-phosphogluconolactonase (cycloisomerase 2 family)